MWYLSAKYARPACTGGKHNYIPHVGLVELVSVVLLLFLLAFDFCLFCVVIRFFHPRHMTSDLEGFLYQILSITLFSYLNSWERASIFPFECWVLNKSTTGTIFITYLVWRGPWLGIEPGLPALEASTLSLGYLGGSMYIPSSCCSALPLFIDCKNLVKLEVLVSFFFSLSSKSRILCTFNCRISQNRPSQ